MASPRAENQILHQDSQLENSQIPESAKGDNSRPHEDDHRMKMEDTESELKIHSTIIFSPHYIDDKQRFCGRIISFFIIVSLMLFGRISVPDNAVQCIEDHIFNTLEPLTQFFLADPKNAGLRNALQIICSLLMDLTFLITFGNWMFRGRSSRLVMALASFYITRALVQKLVWLPFPKYWWWLDPGFPSLVVPYGYGSDFFFSGHAGFLMICSNEWNKLGHKRLRNFVYCVLGYTIFILLCYRVHYSIDIFTGVFFADWCYMKIEKYQDQIDKGFTVGYLHVKNYIKKDKEFKSHNTV